MAAASLTHFDATMLAVALARIRTGLDASDAHLHWVITAYLLAFGLVLLLGGRMGDVIGRRTMCLVGQGVFLAGAILAATSPNAELLIVARTVQGVGAGLLMPQGAALIQQLFPAASRGKAFAAMGVAFSTATTIGPVLSGAFLHFVSGPQSWRWLFVLYIPISLTVLVGIWRLYPGPPDALTSVTRRIDLLGATLAGVMVVSLLYPFMSQGAVPWGQRPWFTVALGVVAGVLLTRHVRARTARHEQGIIDPKLWVVPDYPIGALVGALYFCGFTAVPVVLSLVLQEGHGLGPLATAALIAPWAVGNGIGAPFGGRAVVRWGRRVVIIGAFISAAAVIAVAAGVACVHPPGLAYVVVPAMLLGGIGTGLTIGPNLTVTLQHVDPVRAGGASAVIQTGQRLGSALGTGMAVGVLFAVLSSGYDTAGGLALTVSAGFLVACAVMALIDVLRSPSTG